MVGFCVGVPFGVVDRMIHSGCTDSLICNVDSSG